MSRPEKEPETELAKRLRAVRKALGDEDRAQFSSKLGLPKNTLGNYERGLREPPVMVIAAYMSVFGVSLQWLVTGKGEMFTNAATAPTSLRTIDTNVLAEISGAVDDVYRSLGQHPSKKLITSVSADIYNAMLTADEPTDLSDSEMLQADIAAHMVRLKKRIINGEVAPGKATA
ncbi:helix-turn-helix transcriptional regulator [uncultured Bartonella sp.]|uniref:helix-turn-helix domain-containing protein n=1 Tax=uncultured Bartonella sp. TaxID=104108 RepID=UPI00261B4CE9|nr:helix-turn-helix transcriptional regulator [uncultured Bartonella sp.]